MIDYDTLNPEQLKAVLHEDGPLLILAGAGSGKTRVLTHRIAHLIEECDVNPYSILAITFTNKAAQEMRHRVDRLVTTGAEDIFVSTFHSMCARFLRRDIDRLGYENSFTIYDADDQKALIKSILKDFQVDTKVFKERTFINAISDAKNDLITAEEYDSSTAGNYNLQKIAAVYLEYQRRLKANNALDFDDLLMKTVELFKEAPDVLERYRRRFRYIMVDEYQDTNHAQFVLLRQLAERIGDDGSIEHNLCVVGDDDQSIYRFRGADIRNILDFESQYTDTTVIKLEKNYRSTQTILDVANGVIENNIERKAKTMWTDNPKGDAVKLNIYDSDILEAKGIADDIEKRRSDGVSLSDCAILYRTNAQSRLLEEQMVVRGIPYKLVGGVNFYSRMEVKDILSYLRTVENGLDSLAVTRILNVPKRGIGNTTVSKVQAYADLRDLSFFEALCEVPYIQGISASTKAKITAFTELITNLRSKAANERLSVEEIIDEILNETGYIDYIDEYADSDDEVIERRSNIDELKNKAAAFEESLVLSDSEAMPLSAFLQEVSLVSDIDEVDDSVGGVTLMTLHSAKGLEFPYVYICGLEEGLFPGRSVLMSEDPGSEIEEERRLFYVGITRAMKELTLSCAKQRMLRGEINFNDKSRFLKEIPPHLLDITSNTKPHTYISERERPSRRNFDDSGFEPDVPYRSSFKQKQYDISDEFIFDLETPSSFKSPKASSSAGPAVARQAPRSFGSRDASTLGFAVGDTVSHMKFGEGVVKDIVSGGKDFEITVDFPTVGTRKMLASFAHLKKV